MVSFNGVDQYGDAGLNDNVLRTISFQNPFSISFFFQIDSSPSGANRRNSYVLTVFNRYANGSISKFNGIGFNLATNGSGYFSLDALFRYDLGFRCSTPYNLSYGQIYHAVLLYEPATGLSMYINGLKVDDRLNQYEPSLLTLDLWEQGKPPLIIGAGLDLNDYYVYYSDSKINHLAFFNRTLTEAEIRAIHRNGGILPVTTHEACVAHYPMTQKDGVWLYDQVEQYNYAKPVAVKAGSALNEYAYIKTEGDWELWYEFQIASHLYVAFDSVFYEDRVTQLNASPYYRHQSSSGGYIRLSNGASGGIYVKPGDMVRLRRSGTSAYLTTFDPTGTTATNGRTWTNAFSTSTSYITFRCDRGARFPKATFNGGEFSFTKTSGIIYKNDVLHKTYHLSPYHALLKNFTEQETGKTSLNSQTAYKNFYTKDKLKPYYLNFFKLNQSVGVRTRWRSPAMTSLINPPDFANGITIVFEGIVPALGTRNDIIYKDGGQTYVFGQNNNGSFFTVAGIGVSVSNMHTYKVTSSNQHILGYATNVMRVEPAGVLDIFVDKKRALDIYNNEVTPKTGTYNPPGDSAFIFNALFNSRDSTGIKAYYIYDRPLTDVEIQGEQWLDYNPVLAYDINHIDAVDNKFIDLAENGGDANFEGFTASDLKPEFFKEPVNLTPIRRGLKLAGGVLNQTNISFQVPSNAVSWQARKLSILFAVEVPESGAVQNLYRIEAFNDRDYHTMRLENDATPRLTYVGGNIGNDSRSAGIPLDVQIPKGLHFLEFRYGCKNAPAYYTSLEVFLDGHKIAQQNIHMFLYTKNDRFDFDFMWGNVFIVGIYEGELPRDVVFEIMDNNLFTNPKVPTTVWYDLNLIIDNAGTYEIVNNGSAGGNAILSGYTANDLQDMPTSKVRVLENTRLNKLYPSFYPKIYPQKS